MIGRTHPVVDALICVSVMVLRKLWDLIRRPYIDEGAVKSKGSEHDRV